MSLKESIVRALAGDTLSQQATEIGELKESLAILSQQLSREIWVPLNDDTTGNEFNWEDRKTISNWALIYFIKNPLIGLAVTLKTTFIFGNGPKIKAKDPLIEEVVINDFWQDSDNRNELTRLSAMQQQSHTLQLDGNLFFTLFTKIDNGKVKISSIPATEIDDIITHPQNRNKALWYKRTFTDQKYDYTLKAYGSVETKTLYYKDWQNNDPGDSIYDPDDPKEIATDSAGEPILIYHVKVNCVKNQKFGISETYRAHDWAKAYTDFLQNLASIWKSLSIFAAERKLPKGTSTQIAAAKAATRTYDASGNVGNVVPSAGSTRISNDMDNWSPVKTSGVTMSADDGRRLLLMVCAAMGIFEHYFGDGSNSNLASTTSMELPMLKMFEARQSLFEDIFRDIFDFVIQQSAKASGGKLSGYAEWDEDNKTGKLRLINEEGDEISQMINVDFPPISVKEAATLITALKTALTLDGSPISDTPMITAKQAAREVLTLLNVDGIDEILSELYPEPGEGVLNADAEINKLLQTPMPSADQLLSPREAALVMMMKNIRESLAEIKEMAKKD